MRKYITKIGTAAMLSLILALFLTGCGHEHTWTEATCTEPKICTECGETEGEAAGHVWSNATCTVPKTCKTCNKTEGVARGHDLTEANFQKASSCTVCKATVGEPLTPYYVEHEVPLMDFGKEYDCILHTGDSEHDTVAKVRVGGSVYFDSDDDHPAKSGYEYHVVDIKVFYSDKNARTYGVRTPVRLFDDYYDSKLLDDSSVMSTDEGGNVTLTYKINYYGVEREVRIIQEKPRWKTSDGTGQYTITFDVLVPAGYDGVVIGIRDDPREDQEENLYDYSSEEGHCIRFRLG